jgi:hypothetical protein
MPALIFMFFSYAQAQKLSNKKIETWKITSFQSGGIRGFIESSSFDSDGNFERQHGTEKTNEKFDESFVEEINVLIRELDLPRSKMKTVRGKGIYDGIYSGFTITLNGKVYRIEGSSFYDEKYLAPTTKQKETLKKLSELLVKIRTMPPKDKPAQKEIPLNHAKLKMIFRY